MERAVHALEQHYRYDPASGQMVPVDGSGGLGTAAKVGLVGAAGYAAHKGVEAATGKTGREAWKALPGTAAQTAREVGDAVKRDVWSPLKRALRRVAAKGVKPPGI